MSVRSLEDAIKKRVLEATKGIQLTNDKGEYVSLLVETGALPKEAVRGNPYLLIQTTKISDEDMESNVEVLLLYGTVGLGKEEEKDSKLRKQAYAYGHWDVITVIDKLRSNFLKNVNFDFGCLNRKIQHEVFGEVNFPYFLGETRLKFEVPTIFPEDEYL